MKSLKVVKFPNRRPEFCMTLIKGKLPDGLAGHPEKSDRFA
jgi:hypothetical protein